MDPLLDTLDRLKAVLVSRATNGGCDPNEYQDLRNAVMARYCRPREFPTVRFRCSAANDPP